jgi:hypothetical protein
MLRDKLDAAHLDGADDQQLERVEQLIARVDERLERHDD